MTGRVAADGERLREGFFRDGYVVVRDLFTGDEVARMRAALDRVVDQVRADPDAFDARYTLRGPDDTDTWGVNYIYLPPLYDPALAIPFENRDLLGVFRVVLGPQLRFGNAHALWSPDRSDYELYWHRDSGEYDAAGPPRQGTHIQFNVALTDDACFRCVPGSQARVPTTLERTQVEQQGTSPLPGEMVVACEPGDVLLTNSDLVHRGSCRAGTLRRTLHMSVQPRNEPTGGQYSWRYARLPGFLDSKPPTLRELMRNAIEWDDAHPLSLAQQAARARRGRKIRSETASPRE